MVRTIDAIGKQIGILPIAEALALAREKDLDLVEVASTSDPPVCRVMDYGKYRYDQTKKEKIAKKHQHATKLKEIKLRPNIDNHDLGIKERRAREFLEEGHKVKVTVSFRGREMAHRELGREVLRKMGETLEDVGAVEMQPKITGRLMTMLIGPVKSH